MYRDFVFLAALAAGCGLAAGEPGAEPASGEQQLRVSDQCLPPAVLVCHADDGAPWPKPLCLAASAVEGHLAHGDAPGDCPQVGQPRPEDEVSTATAPAELRRAPVGRAPVAWCGAAHSACASSADCCPELECAWGVCLPRLP